MGYENRLLYDKLANDITKINTQILDGELIAPNKEKILKVKKDLNKNQSYKEAKKLLKEIASYENIDEFKDEYLKVISILGFVSISDQTPILFDDLISDIKELQGSEHIGKGILLKDMVENKKELDKKEQYNFRFNKRLMDNLKSYAKLKGVTTTDIIITSIEKELKNVVPIREELNEPVPVYKDNMCPDEFLGYVNWNNYLDLWNGETYCYNNELGMHRGLSKLNNKYVLIREHYFFDDGIDLDYIKQITENIRKGSPKEYIGVIIPKKEAIKEILRSEHVDLWDMFPELENIISDAFEDLHNDSNHDPGKPFDISTKLLENISEYEKMDITQEKELGMIETIENLKKENQLLKENLKKQTNINKNKISKIEKKIESEDFRNEILETIIEDLKKKGYKIK